MATRLLYLSSLAASHLEFGNALGNSIVGQIKASSAEAALADRQQKAKELAATLGTANKQMDIFEERVGNTMKALDAIESALQNPEKLALLQAKGFDEKQLTKLRVAYRADLASDASYFNNSYDPTDESTAVEALKAQRMGETLERFGIHRLATQQDLDARGIKLNVADFDDNGKGGSGYFGALFHDETLGTYYYANRGTEFDKGIAKAVRDGVADVANSMGYADAQYEKAVGLSGEIYKALLGNVTFTGHSLGGGLATAQALATNGRAITFNAASVSERVASKLVGIDIKASTASVDAYHLKGELVSWMQDSPGWDVFGAAVATPIKWAKGMVDTVRGWFGADTDSNFGLGTIAPAYGNRISMDPIFKDGNNPTFTNDRIYNNYGFAGMDLGARATLHFNSSVLASFEHRIQGAYNAIASASAPGR